MRGTVSALAIALVLLCTAVVRCEAQVDGASTTHEQTGGDSHLNMAGIPAPVQAPPGEDDEPEDAPVERLVLTDDVVPEFLTAAEVTETRERIKGMFYHAYESYLEFSFPQDEVTPLTCKGKNTLGGLALTLIDTLDFLFILGDTKEFVDKCKWVIENLSFDKDVEVVTFEANIRYVGGLLSAHLILQDPNISPWKEYKGELLKLAIDLGDRLLIAFDTDYGLPMKKINLKKGRLPTHLIKEYNSVADSGTYLMEFGMLSEFTGDPKYINAAKRAVRAIYDRRSECNLLGTNINIFTGEWTLNIATTGSGIDSFYEYLVKYAVLFNDEVHMRMFRKLYKGARKHLRDGRWYLNGDMNTCKITTPYVNGLQVFWPGMQVLTEDPKQIHDGIETLQAYVGLAQHYGFFPEVADVYMHKTVDARYLLRPELIESLYMVYNHTRNPLWRLLGQDLILNIDELCKVPCGYAAIKNVVKKTLTDQMESYFLAETLKYAYLLYSDTPLLQGADADGRIVFNTEAHPLWIPRTLKAARAAAAGAAPTTEPPAAAQDS